MKNKLRYIDLFSGIGGFHQALNNYDSECVFASEIDKFSIESYYENYKINSDFDVKNIDEKLLFNEKIDLLCGGFPCQSFSKAGNQLGFHDQTKGTMFFEIERILKIKLDQNDPIKYVLLENVANLVTHDNGNTYVTIFDHLKALGYILNSVPIVVSPNMIGIPQLRKRVFIIGIHRNFSDKSFLNFDITKYKTCRKISCYDILDKDCSDVSYAISKYENEVLTAWDEFYKNINLNVIGFPIWIDFFQCGSDNKFPDWKKKIIEKNRKLYKDNSIFIDNWILKYDPKKRFAKSHCKFEWQAGESITSLWDGIIQFRPSGVRVKKPTAFPALVAMVQIPIVGKYKRRLTVREVARLQSFPEDFIPNKNILQAYKQFGNSVNVEVVNCVLNELFENNSNE